MLISKTLQALAKRLNIPQLFIKHLKLACQTKCRKQNWNKQRMFLNTFEKPSWSEFTLFLLLLLPKCCLATLQNGQTLLVKQTANVRPTMFDRFASSLHCEILASKTMVMYAVSRNVDSYQGEVAVLCVWLTEF